MGKYSEWSIALWEVLRITLIIRIVLEHNWNLLISKHFTLGSHREIGGKENLFNEKVKYFSV